MQSFTGKITEAAFPTRLRAIALIELMTKAEFVEKIANKTGLTKAVAEKVLNSFVEVVSDTLRSEERLALANFGTFTVSERKERQGRNPQTGEPLTIPACKVVKFHAGKQLKESVN